MNMVDIAKARYTTKHYDATKQIPAHHIDALLAILQASPSAVNVQPWHFFVVNNDAAKAKILPAIADFNKPRVTDSSLTLVMCAKSPITEDYLQQLLDQEAIDGRFPSEDLKAAQDQGRRFFVDKNSQTPAEQLAWSGKQIYIALGQVLFAAKGMGIDSTAIEGFDDQEMDKLLDLPAKGLKSVVVATFGYRSEDDSNAKRPKSRLADDVIFTRL